MNLTFKGHEVPRPELWGSAGPGLVWHHIIPSSVLRNVWNKVVELHVHTELPEARVAMRQHLLLTSGEVRNVDTLVDRLRVTGKPDRRISGGVVQQLDVAEFNRLAAAAVWPVWNAFEGPRNRSDDPGDSYMDRLTYGLTADESRRMQAVEQLFQQMQAFIACGGAAGLRELSQAERWARPMIRCDGPIRFREAMWVKETGGVWSKRRGGDLSVQD